MSVDRDVITLLDHEQWLRNQSYDDKQLAPLYQLLEQVKDPEIPALSIWDMGILRSVSIDQKNAEQCADDMRQPSTASTDALIRVVITPTYSGCPAMDLIREDILSVLNNAGYQHVEVEFKLSPAWTTSWMSEEARAKMAASGIAPPETTSSDSQVIAVQCPLCGSRQTELISEFGSTACKALYRCQSCLEPFDYFKAF